MGQLVFQATLGGAVNLVGPNTASTFNLNVPAVASTIATLAAQTFAGTQTFTVDAVVNGLTVGRGAGAVSTNTAVGASALAANTTGLQNTAVGQLAMRDTTTGQENTALGRAALYQNTTGSMNSVLGTLALQGNSTGSNNTALGYQALQANSTASNNTAVGYQAGYTNATGASNVFLGYVAGYSSTGSNNVFIGNGTGYSTTGSSNTFIGRSSAGTGSGENVTTGSKNTIIGGYNGNQGGLDIRTANNYIVLSDGDGNPRAYWNNSGRPFFPDLGSDAGTNAVRFNTGTGRLSYDTSSARYKDNIRDSVYGLSHVMQMRSTQFEYKEGGRSDVGLIAEELQPIVPELVGVNKEGQADSVSYDRMVSVLVKAIQELKAEFDAYKASHP